jgi:hypothetical protein
MNPKDGCTTVRLTHSGLTTQQSREIYQGWPWIMALLQTCIEAQICTA